MSGEKALNSPCLSTILCISCPGNCSKEAGHLCGHSVLWKGSCPIVALPWLTIGWWNANVGGIRSKGARNRARAQSHHYVTNRNCRAWLYSPTAAQRTAMDMARPCPLGGSDLIIAVDTSPHKTNRKFMPASLVENCKSLPKETTATSMGRKRALLLRSLVSVAFLSFWGGILSWWAWGPSSMCCYNGTFPCCWCQHSKAPTVGPFPLV